MEDEEELNSLSEEELDSLISIIEESQENKNSNKEDK